MDCKFETRLSDNAGCGNCNALLEKKDPMKLWQEMKRNGFLSPPAFTPTPNKRASKHKNEMHNRKMKFAKIELTNRFTEVTTRNGLLDELNPGIMNQLRNSKVAKVKKVDKFSMVAAPSGLLNELNPGIMSRLRNSEQVYSIIWALVRSEMLENTQSKQESQFKEEIQDNDVNEGSNTVSVGSQVSGCSIFPTRHMHMNSEHGGGIDDLSVAVRKDEDGFDKHEVKSWSSVTTASENTNSNDEIVSSENTSSQEESAMVPPYDRTVANLASQWLVLLCQNIKGRLAALKRSRTRVKDVIQVELPFLISKESSPVRDNDQLSSVECPLSTIPYMHQAKWTALFDQMDKALSEEMNDLIHNKVPYKHISAEGKKEIWLNQIEEMQLHVGQLECKTDIS